MMATNLKYMPAFRLRQQEELVLKSFDFKDDMYPYIEIIKEFDRPRKKQKTFEEIHIPVLKAINCKKVFIDLPVQLKALRSTKPPVLKFLLDIVSDRKRRTEYILKLASLSEKLIPVVTSYFQKTGERRTIVLQEKALRGVFQQLAFRTTGSNFNSDISQIESVVQSNDYLIVDFGEEKLSNDGEEFEEIIETLENFEKCTVIILKSAIPKDLKNNTLAHGKVIATAANEQLELFKDFNADAFGDYVGIKKDDVTEGGSISPGFVYYDATSNKFFGYRGKKMELEEFEATIVPDVIAGKPTANMLAARKGFLSSSNVGWRIINRIRKGDEPGKSMSKFKRISMEHYLHCVRTLIENGDI